MSNVISLLVTLLHRKVDLRVRSFSEVMMRAPSALEGGLGQLGTVAHGRGVDPFGPGGIC